MTGRSQFNTSRGRSSARGKSRRVWRLWSRFQVGSERAGSGGERPSPPRSPPRQLPIFVTFLPHPTSSLATSYSIRTASTASHNCSQLFPYLQQSIRFLPRICLPTCNLPTHMPSSDPAGYELAESLHSPRLDKGKHRAKDDARDEVDELDDSDEEAEELLKRPDEHPVERGTAVNDESIAGRERRGSGSGGTRGNGGGRDGKLLDRMLGGMSASQRRVFGKEMLREVCWCPSLSSTGRF